jgi:hypothetical protein
LVLEKAGVLKKKHRTTHQPAGKIAQSWCGNATPLPDRGVQVSTAADMTTPVKNADKPLVPQFHLPELRKTGFMHQPNLFSNLHQL